MKKTRKLFVALLAVIMTISAMAVTAYADGGSAGVSSAISTSLTDPYGDRYSGYKKTFSYSQTAQGTTTGWTFAGVKGSEHYIRTEMKNSVKVSRMTVKSVPVYYYSGAAIDDTRVNNAYNTTSLTADNWFPVGDKLTFFFTVETQHTYSQYRTFGIYGV